MKRRVLELYKRRAIWKDLSDTTFRNLLLSRSGANIFELSAAATLLFQVLEDLLVTFSSSTNTLKVDRGEES